MAEIADHIRRFERDGFLLLPGALSAREVERLRAGLERAFAKPLQSEEAELRGPDVARFWRPRLFEQGPEFENLVDHANVIDLIEAILGADCHLIAMNALKTGPGDGISTWHTDEAVRFPRPADVPLDPRVPVPCFVVNMNYYLCDVDEELGPTQFIPGSQRSGRQPGPEDMDSNGLPIYEGRGVVSAVGKAGTAVLWNDQIWHRGATNLSQDRFRWVQQAAYGRRYISQRFWPYVKYQMPDEILERANPRRKRLLGLHHPDNYG